MPERTTEQSGWPTLNRLKILLASDEHRVPLQTTAGVLLAFCATFFMGRENMSWGVFSALFVVQASIGGTVSTGLERVAPDFYVVEGALEKVVAIGIGSACGIVAAVAVLPVSARRRAEYHLSEALRACGRLLEDFVRHMADGEKDQDGEADAEVSYALSRARDMSGQAQAERAPMARPDGTCIELLGEVERFRYTLTLIDRFSESALPDYLRHRYRDGFYALCDAARQQIERLADAIVARTPCEPVPEVTVCFDDLSRHVDQALQDSEVKQVDRERLIAVKEAFAAMLQNLMRLCDRVSRSHQA